MPSRWGGGSHWLALALSIVFTAFSQGLLRRGAKNKKSLRAVFLNFETISGYGLFLIVVLLMIYAMQQIPMRDVIAWNSLTYILTPIAAKWLASDPLNIKMGLGSVLIATGILFFSC